jgi:hypothetical protein
MQKEKPKENMKIYTKSNKRSNLDHLFPGDGIRKRGMLTVYIRIKLQVDLQGTLLPSNVNPRYQIRGTMCDARINLIKPRTLIFER